MKKTLLSAVISAAIATAALADTSSMSTTTTGMGVLQNNWVKAGVNGTVGTFGSGGNTSPGLLFDPSGTGTFNPSYDYLTPGSPFDGFAVMVDGTNYNNNNGRTSNITGDGNGLTDGTNSLSWTGGVSGVFNITNTYTLGTAAPYIDVTSQITMGTAATNVYFAKFIDPDSQGMPGDSSATDNVLGYGVIPESNVAFSEATVSRYALGLYSTDSNVDAGITGWTTTANSYTDADSTCGAGVTYCNGDDTIGLTFHWSSVASGDILTANYAYIFGPSAFDAAEDAVTGGAGGGADTSSWGTLEDVGSATDAASGASTPVITYSDPVVDTDLPVLTQSQTTHSASETATIQTIDRETTTIVTTPMEIITYTDGVETARTPTDSVVVTTVTDPGSFTGRIDQMATADNILSVTNRSLSFEGVNFVRNTSDMDNGMGGDAGGLTFGGTHELENGWRVGVGAGRVNVDVRDVGTADVESTLFNLHGGRKLTQGDLDLSLIHAQNDYSSTRIIGDFSNASTTKGTDTWANVTFTADTGGRINPVVGFTHGVREVDGYTETGSIQSARTVADSKEWYSFGTLGLQADVAEGVNVEALYHTDGVKTASVNVERQIKENTTLVAGLSRNQSDYGSTNAVAIGIKVKF